MSAASKAVRIIETGSVHLGREIEMLSPIPPYHHQDQCAKAIKEPKRISGVLQNPRAHNANQQGAPRTCKFSRSGCDETNKRCRMTDLNVVVCFSSQIE